MLKLLTPINHLSSSEIKCGEIFYQNFNNCSLICTICQMKSFHFDEFLLHIQNNHLENYLHDTKSLNKLNDSIEDLEVDILHDEEKQFTEGSDFDTESSFSEEELLKVLKRPKNKHEIGIQKRCLDKKHDIQFNQDNADNSNENSDNKPDKTSKQPEYSCPDCQQIFSIRKHMDQHVFECHNGYKCSQCYKRFRLPHHHKRHELTHQRNNNDRKRYPCNMTECKKIFTDPDVLKRHLDIHTMVRNFRCEFENCGKSFSTQNRLKIHKNNAHTAVKKFVCDSCGYSCLSYGTLSIHQRRHTGEKPFACEICRKCFVSKGALNVHMITHSTTRDHVCEICQATFANYRILQRHRFIHSDKKTFQCKLCDKAFKQYHGLDGHMRRLHMEPKEKKDINKLEIFQT